jgi:cytochrome P450
VSWKNEPFKEVVQRVVSRAKGRFSMSDQAVKTEAPIFNPASPEFVRNPYPAYHQLRNLAPIFKTPVGFWLATRYDDVNAILRDKRFGKDFEDRTKAQLGEDIFEIPVYNSMRNWMLVRNPPDHTRLRGLVARIFTPKRITALKPRIEQLVDELLDEVEAKGEMNVIRDFAYPLPVNVICDMLGVPTEDRGQFYTSSEKSGRLIDPTPLTDEELEEANSGHLQLAGYFQGLINKRRAEPKDDLLSVLAQANEDGEILSDDELIANTILLFGAGHETTVNLIGNGLLALLSNPDQFEALKADPSLINGAVEEMLRYDSSVQLTSRTALEDAEINGALIAKGETVITLLGAANRDPEQFDRPDEFDVTRKAVRPTSFGGGIHHCLGAPLARMEGQIAFTKLLERFPNMRLKNQDHTNFKPTYTLRGLIDLPIEF